MLLTMPDTRFIVPLVVSVCAILFIVLVLFSISIDNPTLCTVRPRIPPLPCLLYTSDAADEVVPV